MTHTRRERDALIRNSRPTKQERLDKVPSTTEGRGSRSKALEHERKLLAQRAIVEDEIRKKYDELDVLFQKKVEITKKIEEQREKQTVNTFHLEEPW